MNWQVLLSGTPIGEAEALHTFVYYDGPRLQSIRNKAGQTFLAFWLDDLDGHVEVWALVPLSLGRYNEALRGEHDLYRLLTQPEDNYVYRVRIKAKTNTASVEIVRPEAFSDDVLPARGAVLPALDPLWTLILSRRAEPPHQTPRASFSSAYPCPRRRASELRLPNSPPS
jgi:hypothetical protein